MSKAILRLEGLTIGYRQGRKPGVEVGRDLNAVMRQGELTCLLGPNGAGKSTLMRTMSGMQRALAGRVLFDGTDVSTVPPRELARRLSVVLTERPDTGLLSAYELVAMGRHPFTDWTGRLTETDHQAVHAAIQAVGAEELRERSIGELSDGERQKVMVARALAQGPRVMILDEVTAFLDLPRRVETMRLLRRLAREQRCAILLSSHDLDLSLRCADSVWLMAKSRDGAKLYTGTPEDLVLAGVFEEVFATSGVAFDRHAGSFHMTETMAGTACVTGPATPVAWTMRALQRHGYGAASASSAQVLIEVDEAERGYRWIGRTEGRLAQCTSIGELMGWLAGGESGQTRTTP